ncbi:MAG: mannose-1-phosphate guanylyltransferase [Prevotella sp.]|nr:mannose-1-phosphate guanylyltransferase [Prevotella sp.]
MSLTSNHYCVILAGGRGRRLWPCSREEKPKQFIDFFGTGRTQLQQTYDRLARILPKENIYINTLASYYNMVREQLPEVPPERILAEPVNRNTAPSVAWACHRIHRINPDACLLASPSDQAVLNEEEFQRNVAEGFDFVEANNCLLTMGVKPTRPEPGYGYIQIGATAAYDVFKVKSFTEKPDRDFARMFVQSGEFYWNTGIFLANVGYLWRCFSNLLPLVLRNLDRINPHWGIEEENSYIAEHFPSYPNLSMDYGILEKGENVYMLKCNFGWADIGTWHAIYEAKKRGDDDNVVIDSDVMLDSTKNCIIKMPKGKLAVINGLDGYIVAEEGNVLLICKKEDSSGLVRKFVTEVQMKKGVDYV